MKSTLRRMERGVDVSKSLPALLEARDMSQQALADATGIRRTDINAYCKGRKRLGADNGPKIAHALGLEPNYFTPAPPQSSPEIDALQARAEELLRDVAKLRRQLGGVAES